MATLTYAAAAKQALAEEMRRDPTIWALGEDLGRGGVFGQYQGMAEEFGPERIADTPISEAAILGAAVGAAMSGTRPVVEMRFADFALCAVDELVNQAAKARYMFGGQTKVPLVVREPMGMCVHLPRSIRSRLKVGTPISLDLLWSVLRRRMTIWDY